MNSEMSLMLLYLDKNVFGGILSHEVILFQLVTLPSQTKPMAWVWDETVSGQDPLCSFP